MQEREIRPSALLAPLQIVCAYLSWYMKLAFYLTKL